MIGCAKNIGNNANKKFWRDMTTPEETFANAPEEQKRRSETYYMTQQAVSGMADEKQVSFAQSPASMTFVGRFPMV